MKPDSEILHHRLLMYFKITPQDKTKAFEKGFNENYGKMMIFGGCYSGSKIANMYTAFNYFISFFGIYCTIRTPLLVADEFGLFSEALHFISLLPNIASTCLWYLLNGKSFDNLYRAVGSGFYNYGDTFDSKTFKNMIDKQRYLSKEIKRKHTEAYITLLAIVGITYGILRPIYEFSIGKYDYPGGSDGILVTWFPFDPESNLHFIGANIFEYYHIFLTSFRVVCIEIPIITVSEEICSEFKILAKGVEIFDQRAIALYRILYGNHRESNQMNKKKFEHCIKLCLSDSVRHHNILKRTFKDLKRILFYPLITGILSSALTICFSSFLFIDKSVPLSVKICFMVMLQAEVIYTFSLCWYGQRIKDASTEIGNVLYKTNWYKYSEFLKSFILIMQPCAQRPLKLTAAGFIDVELSTFLDICKSAFSYFSILQAFNE
ncbi:hypothetical protein O3M35_011706 [Rhynocoris fuscipes]|uniref:Odorant receptor n=1 Tax=Rhynocoris fuscipes TaxID=488301 RepID=A0AAW1D3X4_9HEMI